jgi:hypothetical protein
MNKERDEILAAFAAVQAERLRRRSDAALGRRVRWIKRLQHLRLAITHEHLLRDPAWGEGGRFFLDHLYGDRDDEQRDVQFMRVLPTMLRVLPAEGVTALCRLAELHAMSERLDGRMGECLQDLLTPGSAALSYVAAWRAASTLDERLAQVDAMKAVGLSLASVVHRPMLSSAVRLMRAPAQLAGLSQLHAFLAEGLRCFRGIDPVESFLDDIAHKEASLIVALFAQGGACPEVIAQATSLMGEVPW